MKSYKFILNFCVAVIVALICWYYFVYKTFYFGYLSSEVNQSEIIDTVSSKILKYPIDDNTKKDMLNDLFKNVSAKITVKNLSDNTLFCEKNIENGDKFVAQTLFVMKTCTDNINYEVTYTSYYKPKLIYAIKSAIYMNKDLVQERIRKQSNTSFLNLYAKVKRYYYNHILSIKFWLLVIIIMLLIYRKKVKSCFF